MGPFESEKIDLKKMPTRLNIFLVLSVIIAALASMSNVSLTINSVSNITLLVMFLYVVSRLIYRDVYIQNVEEAKKSKEYEEAEAEYKATAAKIYEEGLAPRLTELCIRYREEELRSYRTEILSDECISYGIYESHYRSKTKKELIKAGLSSSAIKCIRRADRAKGVYLSTDTLLAGDCKTRRRGDIFRRSSERQQSLDQLTSGLAAFAKTALVGVISISVAFDLSLQAIAQWGVRMLPIATAALSAAPAGRKNIYNVAIPYIKNKTAVLKTMLAWEEAEKYRPLPPDKPSVENTEE